jgi:hypothetical protein
MSDKTSRRLAIVGTVLGVLTALAALFEFLDRESHEDGGFRRIVQYLQGHFGPMGALASTTGAVAWVADRTNRITIVRSDASVINRFEGALVDLAIGGNRRIAVSDDGSYAVFASAGYDAAKVHLARYGVDGEIAWSISLGRFVAADIDRAGNVYALVSTVLGDNLLKIDGRTGGILAKAPVENPFDLSVDSSNLLVWVGGADIRLFDLDLNQKLKIDPISWFAVSVDVAPDGSLIVAEAADGQGNGVNRLLRVTIQGKAEMVLPLDFRPSAVRVDSGWRIWTGGIGDQLVRIDLKGGRTAARIPFEPVRFLAIERGSGVLWAATSRGRIVRFSPTGKMLNEIGGFGADDKAIDIGHR